MGESDRRALYWIFALAAPVALLAALLIAFSTQINRHPDEILHLDAIRYYAEHWLPPPLNADGLVYGPDGWSRVHNGELVYWCYGRAVALLRLIAGAIDGLAGTTLAASLHLPYNPLARLLNIALFGVTLAVLAAAARRQPLALAMGLLLVSVPQIVYLYAYSNSDAWGLSWVVFGAVFAIRPGPLLGRPRDAALLGLLLAMILLSKEPFWLGLPFLAALALLRPGGVRRPPQVTARSLRAGAAACLLALAIVAPFKLLYPLSQGDYAALATATRDQRAWPGFGPSSPTEPSRQLRDKDVPFAEVARRGDWYATTSRSFYGYFGYMSVRLPEWRYGAAALAGALLVATTLTVAAALPGYRSKAAALALLCALLSLGLSLGASLYHSWTVDFQPQGRYLLGSVPAIAALLGGAVAHEPPWAGRLRLALWGLLIALGLSAILTFVPGNPLLQ